jgi:hypothetical protein
MASQLKTKQLNSHFMTEVRVFTQFCAQLVTVTEGELSFPHNELAEQTRKSGQQQQKQACLHR